MTPQVVIAVRGGDDPKSRLAPVLGATARAELTRAMLADMLQEIAVTGAVCSVVTPDLALGPLPPGVRLILQEGRGGLNAAFIQGLESARRADSQATVALLPGDLALLDAEDLRCVLASEFEVSAVRSGDGGTGALVLRAGVAFAPLFGVNSFARHARSAAAQTLSFIEVNAPSLAFDLDQPADIAVLLASDRNSRAAALLRAAGLSETL